MELRDSDETIYSLCISRISDINRYQFNYRILYVSVIAAFFTALNFFTSIADRATVISFLDAYLLVTALVTLATLIGIFTISVLDGLMQELLEDCASSAESIEYTNPGFTDRRIFARPSSTIISLLINSAIFLFYAVPGAIIFGFIFFAHNIAGRGNLGAAFPEIASAICPFKEKYNQTTGELEKYEPLEHCVKSLEGLQVSSVPQEIISVCFDASVCIGILFLMVHFHRIVGRFILLLLQPPYPSASVRYPPYMAKPRLKYIFDKTSTLVIVSWLIGSVATLAYKALGLLAL